MDRENIMFVLFRSIRFLQDVPGEIAFLDGIADHDMLDRFCGCGVAAMTGLDPHAQVVIIFLPSVVLNLEKDPVEQPCFVAIHQLCLEVRLAGLRHLLLTHAILRNATE